MVCFVVVDVDEREDDKILSPGTDILHTYLALIAEIHLKASHRPSVWISVGRSGIEVRRGGEKRDYLAMGARATKTLLSSTSESTVKSFEPSSPLEVAVYGEIKLTLNLQVSLRFANPRGAKRRILLLPRERSDEFLSLQSLSNFVSFFFYSLRSCCSFGQHHGSRTSEEIHCLLHGSLEEFTLNTTTSRTGDLLVVIEGNLKERSSLAG